MAIPIKVKAAFKNLRRLRRVKLKTTNWESKYAGLKHLAIMAFMLGSMTFSMMQAIAQEPVAEEALDIGDIVVTGTKTEKRIKDAPVVTDVITQEQIADKGALTLYDVLEGEPSIRVEQQCSNCNFSILRMMGLGGNNSVILIDGQPIYSGLAGVYGLQQIQAGTIERIEIVKGAGSALYGSNAIAGIVNVILKDPTSKDKSRITGQLGTDNTNSLSFSTSGRKDNISYIVTGQKNVADARDESGGSDLVSGWKDQGSDRLTDSVEYDNKGVNTKLFFYDVFGTRERIGLSLNFLDEMRRGGNLDDFDDAIDLDNERIDTSRYEFGVTYRKVLDNDDVINMYLTRVNHHRIATNGAAWDNSIGSGIVDDNTNLTSAAINSWDAANNGVDLYTAGSGYFDVNGYASGDDAYEAALDLDIDGDGYITLDEIRPRPFYVDEETTVFDMNYNTMIGKLHDVVAGLSFNSETTTEDINRHYNKKEINDFALYAQDDVKLSDQWELVLGMRYDKHDSSDMLAGAVGDYDESIVNPRIALRYAPNMLDTYRFSIGKGYMVPSTFAEEFHLCASAPRIYKPGTLEPEKSTIYTLSYDHESPLNYGLTLFHITIDDKIKMTDDLSGFGAAATGYDFGWENGGKASTTGFEVSVGADISMNNRLQFDYIYTIAEFSDLQNPADPLSDNIMRSPKHQASFSYNYDDEKRSGWRFVWDTRYYGKMYIEHTNDTAGISAIERTDAYMITDIRLSKKMNKTTKYYIGVENLFDYIQERRDTEDAAYLWAPIYGRTLYTGFEFEF